MPQSLSASDSALMGVWVACLALAAVSLTIALALTVKRWFEGRAQARSERRRAELSSRIYALMAAPREPAPDMLPPLRRGDETEILTIALDILRATRGADAVRMVRIVRLFGIQLFLEKQLRKGPRPLRIRILTLLSRFEDPESLELLRRHIDHPAMYVQMAALRGIADRGDQEYLRQAVGALAAARETNAPLLADILRRFGESAIPSLIILAHTAGVHGVRIAAIRAMGSIGSLMAFGDLSELAAEPDPVLRAEAIAALGRMRDARAVPDVLRGLDAREESVRVEAAIAAGMLGAASLVSALADRLEDPAWQVRYRAAEALYRLGMPGIAVLQAATRGPGPGAEMARELLAEMEGIAA